MIIKLIWAQDSLGGIGINNKLPWHFSEDLQKFNNKNYVKSKLIL